MSAFVVSATHIDAMVTAGLQLPAHGSRLRWMVRDLEPEEEREAFAEGQPWGPGAVDLVQSLRRELRHENAGQVGAMLLAENRRSVNHRYAEDEWEEPYLFSMLPGRVDPIVILSAISCYRYQSCEHPEWPKSEAYRFCEALEAAAIRALPGFDAAPWEINDRQVFVPKPAPVVEAPKVDPLAEIAGDRNATIKRLRAELKRRSGKAWSVTGGRGTAWGWITVSAPPARLVDGYLSPADAAELGALLGKDGPVHCQGENIPASRDYRLVYLQRAAGVEVTATATPYWD